ncbi:CHAT domain-containing protein [Nocardia sp. NPDC056064]|uniref:CHAT domain-containing protein n=1 Tax=Nocardia sp. NPDC056064 TaxID=3345701 RepID=UPI0035E1FABB
MRFLRRKADGPEPFSLADMKQRTDTFAPRAAAAYESSDRETILEFCTELRQQIAEMIPQGEKRPVACTLVDFMRWYILLLARLPTPPWIEIARFGLVQSGFYSQVATSDPPNREAMDTEQLAGYTQAIYAMMQAQRSIQDIAAYAAHRRGLPAHAGMILESSTGSSFHATQFATSLHVLGPDGHSAHHVALEEQVALISDSAGPDLPADSGSVAEARQRFDDYLGVQLRRALELPAQHRLFGAHLWNCSSSAAAVTSGRDIVYLVATHHGSAAIRYPSHEADCTRPDSIELPGLTVRQPLSWAAEIRDVYARYRRFEVRKKELNEVLDNVLTGVGSLILAPVLRAWPEMRRACFIPVGCLSALPLFAAEVEGTPAYSLLDCTVAPSVMALHAADGYPRREPDSAVVAIDPAENKDYLRYTLIEADRIAAIHNTVVENLRDPGASADAPEEPTVEDDAPKARELRDATMIQDKLPETRVRQLISTLSQCSVAHLACHGLVTDFPEPNSYLLLGRGLSLNDYLTGCDPIAPGGTVVLSACSVGGVVDGAPAEQFGFPTVLLSSGSRAVIAPICPVLDSTETVELMAALHRGLAAGANPSQALASAIDQARSTGMSTAIWGVFNIYGH